MWMQLSFLFDALASICRENLQFDYSSIIVRKHIRQYSNTKAGKYSGCTFPFPVGAGGLFSRNTLLLYYFELLFTAIWFKFFKISVLKNFAKFRGKHLCQSLFLISL